MVCGVPIMCSPLHEGSSVRAIDEVFICGEGTAIDAWLKFKDAGDKLISITRV